MKFCSKVLSKEYDVIPQHIFDTLQYFMEDGIHPGGFLKGLLENDLRRAVCTADLSNRKILHKLVIFVINEMPGFFLQPNCVDRYIHDGKRWTVNENGSFVRMEDAK
jgi:hypothetical protein